ncbi:hypothetical protein GIB67_019726 [Kingdonia uniflora]|uniref:DUF1997 family protein n=1 Tax=Kingdonia uniflora TaxID=39325 RepID=A0A7J7MK91_9MAGN|nr:hypothetical protein GIB67_019726 [Kingdonia uniflora]
MQETVWMDCSLSSPRSRRCSSSSSTIIIRSLCQRRLSFPHSNVNFLTSSTRRRALVSSKEDSSSNPRIVNLFAGRRETIKLPNSEHSISDFFAHPSGVEAILNTRALQSFQSLDSNTYRCALPKMQLLNFEVAPKLDLRVTPTNEDCTVEMLSCKFEGSEAVERQNGRFSAFMRNHITWDANGCEQQLNIDVKLNISLEISTRPFTLLPVSAVEKPGNLIMQSLVDRLVPLLLQQLRQDYENWVQEKCEVYP